MRRRAAVTLTAVALALVACGASGETHTAPKPAPVVGPYDARLLASAPDGLVTAERLSYKAFDGETVPALFAIATAGRARACLIWEDGLGSTKEDAEAIWQGAARIGLSTFSIDLRDQGQRGTMAQLLRAIRSPTALAALVTGSVNDLMRAVTILEAQPACHHVVGYSGLSLGGIIGTLLAAQDRDVRAAVLMSVPPTWDAAIHSTHDVDELGSVLLPGLVGHPAALRAALRVLSPLDPDRYVCRIAPRPVLLLAGRHDNVFPPSEARQFQAAACRPKTIVNYDGGHIPLGPPGTSPAVAAANAQVITEFLFHRLVPGG